MGLFLQQTHKRVNMSQTRWAIQPVNEQLYSYNDTFSQRCYGLLFKIKEMNRFQGFCNQSANPSIVSFSLLERINLHTYELRSY